jgi:phage baseplate assembly protein gpV
MNSFLARIVEAERKIAELDRRLRNHKRTGTISEVDTAKGLARVKISDGEEEPYLTGWLPWKEIAAGGIKTHIPPTVGQQVDVVSESGDLTDGVIDFSTPSDANPRPASGADAVITHGDARITIGDGKVEIVADVTIKGDVAIEGSSLTHNDRNVGSTHVHGGVERGGADTDPPH